MVLASIIRQNIEAQARADGVISPRLTCGTLNIGGYPFRFDVDCTDAKIASGDLLTEIPGIRASIMVYRPTHLPASAMGPASITDAFTGLRNTLVWSGLEASIRVDDWRIARLSIIGKDMVWSDTLMGNSVSAQSPLIEAHLLDIPEQHDSERHLAALAGYVHAQNPAYPGLTLTDTNAEIELELNGLPDDIRNWGDPLLLTLWQQAGGRLKVVSVRGSDGTSTLDASGDLKLDDAGRVEGQIDIKSTGVAERIGPLLAEPWRTPVLGTPGADGAYANQLNFRAGGIYSGLVPIASIPPLY
ncbi:DUF2125 domain-containing protein [Devosia sp. A8/3-2]|nr:DUF2125 domain-containing protein [Devosia sp. A8/3-2]